MVDAWQNKSTIDNLQSAIEDELWIRLRMPCGT